MKASITTLKSMFQRGDKPTEKDFEDLIDSFLHKDEGTAIKNVNLDKDGNLVFNFSDGTTEVIKQIPSEIPISSIQGLQNELNSKVTVQRSRQLSSEDFTTELKGKLEKLENYVHPPTHRIDEIEGLQPSLDGKVSTTANETIEGQKVFSEIVEFINGLKISNFSGSGLRNLVVQADGTVDVKAIATDLFVGNTTFDDTTKILTLELVNGSTIDVDLSSLEEDLTGLRANIATLEATTISLQNTKLDKGGYTGTAQDLDIWIKFALNYKIAFNPCITMTYNHFDNTSLSNSNYNTDRYNFIAFYKEEEKKNPSLKKYLDVNRYTVSLRCIASGEKELYRKLKSEIDYKNLNLKQKLLINSPKFLVNAAKELHSLLKNIGFYWSANS